MISAGHIERAFESVVRIRGDYDNCSSSDDRLGTDVGTSANQTLYLSMQYAIVDFAKNVDSTPWLSSKTADQPRPKTTDCQQWFV